MKKVKIPSELSYIIFIIILSFSVAMASAADFGLSMIVAPAYILCLKFPVLTFGQAEYVVQGILFIAMCIMIRKIKPILLVSFATGIIYGAFLDLWRIIVPILNPNVTPPGEMHMPIRIVMFVGSSLITALAVALCFRTYIYPQVYDLFVKILYTHYKLDPNKCKICFDICCLAVSLIMTLALFGSIKGIGVGTVILALCNGILIGLAGKLLDKYVVFEPLFPKFAKLFEI